ncbi:hypothetical protein BKA93DRAFT_725843, partial [Sparassis latifolia]
NIPNRSVVTDESRTIRKAYYTVEKLQVTDHDIHDEYLRDPEVRQNPPRLKQGVREEVDPKQEGRVLGDQATGKVTKETVQSEFKLLNENSLHA